MLLKNSKGVTFVETAIALPFVLAVIFFILWIAYVWFCMYTFNHAVADGARAAAARGAFTRMDNSGLIGRVDSYQTGGTFPEDLFAYQVPDFEAENYLNRPEILGAFDGVWFSQLPGPYLYTMIYMNQALKKGIGRSLKFPCDPVGARAIDGPGCVSCRFLHPELGDTTPWTNTNPNDPLPTDRIYIHCQYQPDVFLIKPMAGMMNLILGGGFTTNPLVFDKYQVLRWYSDRLVVPGP